MKAVVNPVPELLRMIDSASRDNYEQFAVDVQKIADKYLKVGDQSKASRIKEKLARYSRMKSSKSAMRLQESNEYDFYVPEDSKQKTINYTLSKCLKLQVDEIVAVFLRKEQFWEAEIPLPSNTLMFGPPGTGKTLTAHFIAQLLNLPLLLVRLDSIVDSSLGGTAQNLRKVFDVANKQPCILFLDEFDAIAADRNSHGGSGADEEMRRVVNSLLQNIDALNDEVLLFAATNLGNKIDAAVWRRFHNRLDFDYPSVEEVAMYLSKLLKDNPLLTSQSEQFLGLSYADIELTVNRAKTKAILRDALLDQELIAEALDQHKEQRR
ncbi:AAA family ATPase [Shouchella miscanthi]|uniref:AAA family ATPase n=1 Tax=Shouchella miscanthi TaxID=2598861 RepID=UPI0011A78076|nr:ATP-binding protein [Shouchella miscanthi]